MSDTREELVGPENVPEPGFYYHYKHDANGPENGHAYEVTGTGWHTEDETFMVLYRPLYDWAPLYALGKAVYLRPIEMFMDEVSKPEYTGRRFIKIIDPELVGRLKTLRDQMY